MTNNYISVAATMIKTDIEDDIVIQILDSIPSDMLYLIFEDRSEKIQKFKHIYNDILSHKRFIHIDDVVPEISVYSVSPSDKLYSFIKSINPNKRINKEMYLDNILELVDKYVEGNNITDSYNDKLYELFKKQFKILNYTHLNKFRRGLLIISELY